MGKSIRIILVSAIAGVAVVVVSGCQQKLMGGGGATVKKDNSCAQAANKYCLDLAVIPVGGEPMVQDVPDLTVTEKENGKVTIFWRIPVDPNDSNDLNRNFQFANNSGIDFGDPGNGKKGGPAAKGVFDCKPEGKDGTVYRCDYTVTPRAEPYPYAINIEAKPASGKQSPKKKDPYIVNG
jgi:hypothetical protein